MVFALICTGLANSSVCQPLEVSFVNVPVASWVPVAVQRLPVWVPVFPAPL